MNANPAYYQVMYNEMVQKNSSTTGGNLYGADSRHLPTNAGVMKSRKPLTKTST